MESTETFHSTAPAASATSIAVKVNLYDYSGWTVPVLANGLVYGRNAEGKLVCVELPKIQ